MDAQLTFILQARVFPAPGEEDGETVGGLVIETLEERVADVEAIGLSLARFLTDAAQGKAIVTTFTVTRGLDIGLSLEPADRQDGESMRFLEGPFKRTASPPPFDQTVRLLETEGNRTFVASPHGPLPVPTNEELDLADRGEAPPPRA